MESQRVYVKWREVFVLSERGRKEVRYYLKRRDGVSDLVVVGKERRDLKVYRYNIRETSLVGQADFKLKSRKDVIEWLNSVISGSDSHNHHPPVPVGGVSEVISDCQPSSQAKDGQLQKPGKHGTEVLWVGSATALKKKRKHYQSFQRNGVKISVHDFVYVLAEEDKPLVAYLDDMYEDSRGNKMVVVRWFHKIDEVDIALPETYNYNDREIFFSLCLQDLNIECVDGLASVLSPQHYQVFLREARHTRFQPFICGMQFENDDVKPFDITQVKGYSEQKIFDYMLPTSPSTNAENFLAKDGLKLDVECNENFTVKPKKRLRLSNKYGACLQPANKSQGLYDATRMDPKLTTGSIDNIVGPDLSVLKQSVPPVSLPPREVVMQKSKALTPGVQIEVQKSTAFSVGGQIEVLCQDSGVRGCWFRALIIKKKSDKVKVRYLDLKDAADEVNNLEEWLLASRAAVPDEWGFRISRRKTVRPAPVHSKHGGEKGGDGLIIKDGTVVDVWWHDGWWEGIVIQKESEDSIHVYFPAEKRESVFCRKDLRPSQEWLGTGWKQMGERQDLLTSMLPKLDRKPDTLIPCQSVVCIDKLQLGFDQEGKLSNSNNTDDKYVARDIVKDDLLENLKWKTSGKRKRSLNSSRKPLCSETVNRNRVRAFGTRTWEKFFISSSAKVDHENCKNTRESAFSSPVVSPLSNLVLSR
ncbi:hypothetical protein ACET3Z_031988 [Daucus carota]